ncbi:MAG: MOSC domain-containing protein [Gammaproteobacteria bacterium]|nr:MOSC domain-containing protein [Gammaproteobacteria bacterium]
MASVVSVSRNEKHGFSKIAVDFIELVADEGVVGDAHRGESVKHRSRVKKDAAQPNLRQVHLIHVELIQELKDKGFNVEPATLGENITTIGLDLLALPRDTVLRFPGGAELVITGLRTPCHQLDDYQKGLTAAVLDRDDDGNLIRKAGVMAIVKTGGRVQGGDSIAVIYPDAPHQRLEPV